MGNNLFTGIYSGLTNTYSYLASQYPEGLTLEKLTEVRANTANNTNLNQTFASYLQTNFSNIDEDGDGTITSAEMNNLSNMISTKGLSKAELTQLYASGASGLSESMMTKILDNFDEIDANHDGRITSAEISAYDINCARMEKEDEFNNRRATDMSVFYGDSSSATADTYSILSYKYKKNS